MREVLTLTGRTIKLYLKNPLSLLFSFVYMLLIILLFSTFLGSYMTESMADIYAEVHGTDLSSIRWLVDSTAMAGVLMINCILVPLNVLTIMVQDRSTNHFDSFLVTAAKRDKLVFGYWLAPFLIGILLNILCLFITQVFIVLNGGQWLTLQSLLKMIVLILINTFSATSILFVVALLLNNANIYNTITGIVSALIGFITGTFLPIGVFPENMQMIFALFPAHHGATMMREVMTQAPLAAVFGSVPPQRIKDTYMSTQKIINIYCAENGINYIFSGHLVTMPVMIAIVTGSGILFLLLSLLLIRKSKK